LRFVLSGIERAPRAGGGSIDMSAQPDQAYPKRPYQQGVSMCGGLPARDIVGNRIGRICEDSEFDMASGHDQWRVSSARQADRIDKPLNRITVECVHDAIGEQVEVIGRDSD
jgi:hypothetical protein